MINETTIGMTVAAGTAVDAAAVDKAFDTLKGYDWGADREALNPIDQAIIATHGDAAGRAAIEKRLVDLLKAGVSRSASDYICRRLRTIGTAQSVDVLAGMLGNESTSHIARYALERMPDAKALAALRSALAKVDGKLKPGIVSSLGIRRDAKSVAALSKLLGASDIMLARAAAQSLAQIGNPAAASALTAYAAKASGEMKMRASDACLTCAETMLADGKKAEAVGLYKKLQGGNMPTPVKAAAMKGMVNASKK